MRIALSIVALLMLSACGAVPLAGDSVVDGKRVLKVVPTAWVKLDEHELQATCKARSQRGARMGQMRTGMGAAMATKTTNEDKPVNGCYDWIGDVCVIYTRKTNDQVLLNPRFQQTFGHEGIHCHEGLFHP